MNAKHIKTVLAKWQKDRNECAEEQIAEVGEQNADAIGLPTLAALFEMQSLLSKEKGSAVSVAVVSEMLRDIIILALGENSVRLRNALNDPMIYLPGQLYTPKDVFEAEFNPENQHELHQPDPAAVAAMVLSINREAEEAVKENPKLSFSEAYHGADGFLREAMRVAQEFEQWACKNVDFDATEETWVYKMEDDFGKAAVQQAGGVLKLSDLRGDWRWEAIAESLKLPVIQGIIA
jgi:hypothetical protein